MPLPSLHELRLYGILDLGYVPVENALSVAHQMLEGGIRILQLRAKKKKASEILLLSRSLAALCRQNDCYFIVNDFVEIARESGAHGLHIGQDDGVLSEIRAKLNPRQIVGRSTHGLDQAIAAEKEGADYIGIGPIFPTPTKPDYIPVGLPLISEVQNHVKIPGFCIGGIKEENLDQVLRAGAQRVVIVSGILQAPDIVDYCQRVLQKMVA